MERAGAGDADDQLADHCVDVGPGTSAEAEGAREPGVGPQRLHLDALARVGRVPAEGERFGFDGLEIEVLEAERRRIHKVRVRRVEARAPEVME